MSDLATRLRTACDQVRVKSYPLSDLIPLMQQAADALAAAPRQPAPSAALAFQQRVQPWLLECFGAEIAADRMERNHRFMEESLELVQSLGCTASEAHQLVDYVFGRPVGDPPQEVGGVMVTLAALCLANGLDMHDAGEVELARISVPVLVAKIRAKQAAKPKHSPLPESAPSAAPECLTCNDHGAVGNILTAEPCPDCTTTPQADSQPAPVADNLCALFREALAWGMTYGPEIPAHQWDEMRESMVEQYVSRAARAPADSVTAPVLDYPPLPNFDSGDEPIWEAIFKWKAATPGADARGKANKIESAIIETMRAYVDADRAARKQGANHD